MTNQEASVLSAAGVFKRCLEIMNQRSKKYSSPEDPFENFYSAAEIAETTVEQGIMTRFGDKLTRLKRGLAELRATGNVTEFSDESLEDTICDMINYLVILRVHLVSRGGEDFLPFLEESGMIPHPQLGLPGLTEETVPEEEVGMFKRLFQR